MALLAQVLIFPAVIIQNLVSMKSKEFCCLIIQRELHICCTEEK